MKRILALTVLILIALAAAAYAAEEGCDGDCASCGGCPFAAAMAANILLPDGSEVPAPAGLVVELVDHETFNYAGLAGTMSDNIAELFEQMADNAGQQKLTTPESVLGCLYPRALAEGVDGETPIVAFVPLEEKVEIAEPLALGAIPGGYYLRVEHHGSYDKLPDTYNEIFAWAEAHELILGAPSFELYVTDPAEFPVEEWLTEIYLPLGKATEEQP
ncbi:GyrI-like domain-containing protein [bacterium]|nr:GyrI-like domain-containing protein [bacterium]